MFDNRDDIDFGTADIGRLFSKYFFPTLMGMLFSMAFIITDGIFVGHGIGPEGLAAINLVGPIMMIISGLGMMFGIGASVVAAIHLSHDNTKAARINVTQAFMAGIVTSLIVGIVCYCFPHAVLRMLGADGALYGIAYEYYIWFLPTCMLMMIECIGLFVIRLDGSPTYAMIANIIPAVVNIILDYIFIFPMRLGIMGASLATDIGGLVAVLMVVFYMVFKAKTLKLHRIKMSLVSLRLSLRNVWYMIRTGVSGLVGEVAVATMMLAGNLMFKRYLGSDGISAYSIVCYLFPLVYMIYNAVAQTAQPIVSYNYGAGLMQRVRRTLQYSMLASTGIGLAITLVFVFFSPQIVRIFLDEGSVAGALASEGLPYYAIGFVFMAINICMVGYYQSVEKSAEAVTVTMLRGIIFLVLSFILAPKLLGEKGLWLAIPIAELLTVVCVLIGYNVRRNRPKAESKNNKQETL